MGLSVRFLEVLFHEMYAAADSECHCEVQHGDYKKRSKDTAGRTDCVKGKHQFGRMFLTACGTTIIIIERTGPNPIERAASICPGSTDSMPERMISQI